MNNKVCFDIQTLRYKDTEKSNDNNIIKICDRDVNYNLLLNKYIFYKGNSKKRSQKQIMIMPQLRKYYDQNNGQDCKTHNFYEYIRLKNSKIINLYKNYYGYIPIQVPVKTSSRLVIGHGEVSVREVSIKLEHIYGIPMIPSSSIKGAFRNYLNEKYSSIENNKYKENDLITELFGTDKQKGKIIFIDIYPEKFKIGIDVMTPHYGDYYSKNAQPVDTLRPASIKFPVIEKESEFNITILVDKEVYSLKKEQKFLDIKIKDEFKNFLCEKPLGAKTSVGYGYFKEINK